MAKSKDFTKHVPLVVFAAVALLGLGAAVLYASALTSTGRQIVMVVLAALVTLLFAAGTQSTVQGRVWSAQYKLVGAGALFVVTYGLLFFLMPRPEAQTIRVYLSEVNGGPISGQFSIVIRNPGMETISREGSNGEVTVTLAGYYNELSQISLNINGYVLPTAGPHPIKNGSVELKLESAGESPPLSEEELPSPTSFYDMPPSDVILNHVPSLRNTDLASLDYVNKTDVELDVIMFDCTQYYASIRDGVPGVSPWIHIRAAPSGNKQRFNDFPHGSGWFCVTVKDRKSRSTYAGCKNFFDQQTTSLTVTETDGELETTWGNE